MSVSPETVTAVAEAATKAPGFFSSTGEVGTVAAFVAAFAVAFARFAPRLGLERKEASASENLIQNLTDRVNQLTEEFAALQADRDRLFREHAEMSAKMKEIVAVEQSNEELRESLRRRDAQNENLINDLRHSNLQITELTERLHQMELRMAGHAGVCEHCAAAIAIAKH